jgi:hypothetical protein
MLFSRNRQYSCAAIYRADMEGGGDGESIFSELNTPPP